MLEITEAVRNLVLENFETTKDFAKALNLNPSTIDAVFRNGIENSKFELVSQICDTLTLDLNLLAKGIVQTTNVEKIHTSFVLLQLINDNKINLNINDPITNNFINDLLIKYDEPKLLIESILLTKNDDNDVDLAKAKGIFLNKVKYINNPELDIADYVFLIVSRKFTNEDYDKDELHKLILKAVSLTINNNQSFEANKEFYKNKAYNFKNINHCINYFNKIIINNSNTDIKEREE